jgi:hypothetical protein
LASSLHTLLIPSARTSYPLPPRRRSCDSRIASCIFAFERVLVRPIKKISARSCRCDRMRKRKSSRRSGNVLDDAIWSPQNLFSHDRLLLDWDTVWQRPSPPGEPRGFIQRCSEEPGDGIGSRRSQRGLRGTGLTRCSNTRRVFGRSRSASSRARPMALRQTPHLRLFEENAGHRRVDVQFEVRSSGWLIALEVKRGALHDSGAIRPIPHGFKNHTSFVACRIAVVSGRERAVSHRLCQRHSSSRGRVNPRTPRASLRTACLLACTDCAATLFGLDQIGPTGARAMSETATQKEAKDQSKRWSSIR